VGEEIRFRFSLGKFSETLTLLASKVPDLTKLKASKLLYLADRLHLITYGKMITGDTYYALEKGPVPSISLDIINDLIERGSQGFGDDDFPELRARITVNKETEHPTLSSDEVEEYRNLSEAELETIRVTIEEHGNKTVGELIELTHGHIAWRKSWDPKSLRSKIDYRLFFEDAEDADVAADALYFLLDSQEDRDADIFLNG